MASSEKYLQEEEDICDEDFEIHTRRINLCDIRPYQFEPLLSGGYSKDADYTFELPSFSDTYSENSDLWSDEESDQQFTTRESVEDIKKTLASQLSLTATDALFKEGLASPESQTGFVYHLVDSGAVMTWRKPKHSVRLSWHRGTSLKIQSLPVTGGKLSTLQLGDLVVEAGSHYSDPFTTDHWYASRVEGDDSYCLLSEHYTGNETSIWEEADQDSLLNLYPEYSTLIKEHF